MKTKELIRQLVREIFQVTDEHLTEKTDKLEQLFDLLVYNEIDEDTEFPTDLHLAKKLIVNITDSDDIIDTYTWYADMDKSLEEIANSFNQGNTVLFKYIDQEHKETYGTLVGLNINHIPLEEGEKSVYDLKITIATNSFSVSWDYIDQRCLITDIRPRPN